MQGELAGRRDEARPDRPDRREHAGGRPRPRQRHYEKVISNMEEGDCAQQPGYRHLLRRRPRDPQQGVLEIPHDGDDLAPILLSVPLQLPAYHVAVLKGADVDQPRNLVKSVTVE